VPDNSLDILIRTLADTHGAEAVGDSLKRVTASAGESNKEIASGAEKSSEHVRGLHRAVGFLGSKFGELGHLAHFAFSLPTLAIAGLGIAIAKLIEVTKKWEEAILAKAEISAAVWEDQRARANQAADAAAKYRTAVDEIAKSTDTLKTTEDAELKILEAIAKARAAILKAQEEAEIAAAGGDKAKEAEIHARYGARQTREEAEAEQVRINLMKRDLAQAQKDAAAAMAKSKAAEKSAESGAPGADAAVEAAATAEARKKLTARLAADLDKWLGGKTLAELKKAATEEVAVTAPGLPLAPRPAAFAYEKAKAAADALAANQKEIAEAEKKAADFKRADEAVKSEAAKSLDEWRTKDADVQARKRAIDEAEAVQRVQRIESGAVGAARYAATRPGGAQLLQAAEIADAARAGQTLDAGQKALLLEVFKMLGGNARNNAQILEVIRRANDSIADMKRALDIQSSRLANYRRGPTG
jgi:hypothetical protein